MRISEELGFPIFDFSPARKIAIAAWMPKIRTKKTLEKYRDKLTPKSVHELTLFATDSEQEAQQAFNQRHLEVIRAASQKAQSV